VFEEISESIECKVLVRTEVDGDIQAHLCKEKKIFQAGCSQDRRGELKSYVMEVSPIIFQDGGGGGGGCRDIGWDHHVKVIGQAKYGIPV
jgi:hypothetical protein